MARSRQRVLGGLLWALGALLLLGGCKDRSGQTRRSDGCRASRLKEARRWLTELCDAHAQRFAAPDPRWQSLALAPADVKVRRELPAGLLLSLTPQRLLINGRPAPDWPKGQRWSPPDMRRGVASTITRLLPWLRRTLGAGAQIRAAQSALADLAARSSQRRDPARRHPAPDPKAKRPPDLPSGLTVLTLITAKQQLGGRGPRRVHVAIDPQVSALQVVQLQALLALAGFDGVHLLFRPRTAPDPPPPPRPRVLAALGGLATGRKAQTQRAGRLRALRAEEDRWIQQGCDGMSRLRKALQQAGAKRCELLAQRLPDVIRRCRCTRDEGRLLTLWLAALGPAIHIGAKAVRLHPRAQGLAVRRNRPWREIADRVASSPGQHLWLRLDD